MFADDLKWTPADQWLLRKCLGSVRGIQRFRSFLKGTAGVRLHWFTLLQTDLNFTRPPILKLDSIFDIRFTLRMSGAVVLWCSDYAKINRIKEWKLICANAYAVHVFSSRRGACSVLCESVHVVEYERRRKWASDFESTNTSDSDQTLSPERRLCHPVCLPHRWDGVFVLLSSSLKHRTYFCSSVYKITPTFKSLESVGLKQGRGEVDKNSRCNFINKNQGNPTWKQSTGGNQHNSFTKGKIILDNK